MAGDGHPGGMDMDGGMGDMPMSPSSSPSWSTPAAMGPRGPRMHMGGMHMTFFWGKDAQILFTGWPGRRHGVHAYLLALLFVFVLAVLVESLSYAARRLASLNRGGGAQRSSSSPSSISVGLAQTSVQAVRVGVGYLVMLAVMSFNGGVLLAAVAGHALGFFVFGSRAFGRGAIDGSSIDGKC